MKTIPFLRTASTAKVLVSRLLGKLRRQESVQTHTFYRDATGWYIDLPSWPGPKGALAMVCGADTLLEHLSRGTGRVTLDVSLLPQDETQWHVLHYLYPQSYGDGAFYRAHRNGHLHELWLCGVTEFVFGRMPKVIYYRVVG